MDIEKRLNNIEKLVYSLIESQNRIDEYKKYDIDGCMNAEMIIDSNVKINASDISDNRDGLMETFETSMINTDDISALREGLEEVYEMLLESEE